MYRVIEDEFLKVGIPVTAGLYSDSLGGGDCLRPPRGMQKKKTQVFRNGLWCDFYVVTQLMS